MPIVSVWETFENRSYTLDDTRNRTYVRTFMALANERDMDPNQVRIANGVPRLWSVYVGGNSVVDTGCWCRDLKIRQDTQDPFLWRIEAAYSSKLERPDINQIENPLLRPAEISWDTVEVPRVAMYDRTGNAILNSAAERFDPPLEEIEQQIALTITRNQLTYDANTAVLYANAVNKDAWWGFKPGRVKCLGIPASRSFESGILFWRVTYKFRIRVRRDEGEADTIENAQKAWAYKVLDQGYYYIGDGGKLRIATDALGRPTSSPILLNGTGGKLPSGDPPVFLTYYLSPERNFAPLLLP